MIKVDMEMPFGCCGCTFAQPTFHGFAQYQCVVNEDDVEDEDGELYQYRPDYCPLKEIDE